MKLYIEIILIIFLVILMYVKSQRLNLFAQSILGKITLVITVLLITTQYGRNAGILSAVIFMLLLHTSYEGVARYPPKEKKKPVEEKKKPEEKKKGVIQKVKLLRPLRHMATHTTVSSNVRDGDNSAGGEGRDPPSIPPGAAMTAFTNLTDLNRQNRLGSEYRTLHATAE